MSASGGEVVYRDFRQTDWTADELERLMAYRVMVQRGLYSDWYNRYDQVVLWCRDGEARA